jgi:hypothetical protein
MNFKAIFSTTLCALTLSACEPNLRTIGTVEDDKLITLAMIEEMGFEKFEKQYLGKEVTIGDLSEGKYLGGYRPQEGKCIFSPISKDDKTKKNLVIYIYSNHWPDFIIEDQFNESSPEFKALLDYPQETDLPMDVCDEFCEYDKETGACFYKSPHLKITGKIFDAGDISNLAGEYRLLMKLKGVQY